MHFRKSVDPRIRHRWFEALSHSQQHLSQSKCPPQWMLSLPILLPYVVSSSVSARAAAVRRAPAFAGRGGVAAASGSTPSSARGRPAPTTTMWGVVRAATVSARRAAERVRRAVAAAVAATWRARARKRARARQGARQGRAGARRESRRARAARRAGPRTDAAAAAIPLVGPRAWPAAVVAARRRRATARRRRPVPGSSGRGGAKAPSGRRRSAVVARRSQLTLAAARKDHGHADVDAVDHTTVHAAHCGLGLLRLLEEQKRRPAVLVV